MADDRIRIEDKYYIQARSSVTDDRTLVLKHGDTFAVFDRHGDMRPYGLAGHHGLYHADTRFLSHSALRLCQNPLLLLSSTVTLDNALLTVDLTNPDIRRDDDSVIPRGTLHISRSKFIWQNTCYDRLRMMNFSRVPVRLCLELSFDSDFADIFEVRGAARKQRGRLHPAVSGPDGLLLSYEGLDGILRRTYIRWSLAPQSFSDGAATFEVLLPPGEAVPLELSISCENSNGGAAVTVADAATALTRVAEHLGAAAGHECHIYTSNDFFNHWLNRSIADLRMMTTATPAGPFPYAGVPWFSTPFGRDAILTAYEALWVNPDWARGVLAYLAQTQA
ncbi:MAG: glycogen debranching N-terminal domain-containing protein, partial [Opitutaceae bacterium]